MIEIVGPVAFVVKWASVAVISLAGFFLSVLLILMTAMMVQGMWRAFKVKDKEEAGDA